VHNFASDHMTSETTQRDETLTPWSVSCSHHTEYINLSEYTCHVSLQRLVVRYFSVLRRAFAHRLQAHYPSTQNTNTLSYQALDASVLSSKLMLSVSHLFVRGMHAKINPRPIYSYYIVLTTFLYLIIVFVNVYKRVVYTYSFRYL
jgi:hypothetical protein